jgi:hypothetical protein
MSDTVRGALFEKDTTTGTITIRPNYSLTKIDTSSIRLNFFDKIPETISFRGEFYTYDTTKLANDKYIFLTNMTTYAIIKDNGKDIYLEKENDKSLALPQNTYEDIYSGNGYKITFIHKVIKDGYGKSNEIGKLIIENSRHQLIVKIHGGYNLNYR